MLQLDPYRFDTGGLWTPAQITTATWIDTADNSTINLAVSTEVMSIDDKSGNGNDLDGEILGVGFRPFIFDLTGRQVLDMDIDVTYPNQAAAGIDIPFAGVGNYFRMIYFDFSTSIEFQQNQLGTPIGLLPFIGSASTSLTVGYGTPTFYLNGVLSGWTTRGDVYTDTFQSFNLIEDIGLDFSTWSNQVQWGRYLSSSRRGAKYIGEIVFIEGVITLDTRQKMEGYMAWKWGEEGKLPIGHPYEFAAPTI